MASQKMNVLVIMCDHLRYDALSCFGNSDISTPNMDRLADKSVRFHAAYNQAPLCGPTRHSLATGRYAYEHGVVNNVLLPEDGMRTIAHSLSDEGYACHCFGHMHWQRLPVEEDDVFPDHGYHQYHAIHGEPYIPKHKQDCRRWERSNFTLEQAAGSSCLNNDEFYGYHVASESVSQLREWQSSGQPFLSWTSFDEPHPPFYAPSKFYADIDQGSLSLAKPVPDDTIVHPAVAALQKASWKKFNEWDHRRMRAGYFALVRAADSYVGTVLDALDELGLWENTMIVFTSDHGDQLGEHGLYFKSVFREGSVHVPLMIYHPDFQAGDCQQLVEHVDIFPTICDCAGVSVSAPVSGQSLKPLMECPAGPALRQYVVSQLNKDVMIRSATHKLNFYDGVPGELFDLQADPDEFHNRLNDPDCASVRAQLEAALNQEHPELFTRTEAHLNADRRRRKKRKPRIVLMETD